MRPFASTPLALRVGPPILLSIACATLFALLLMRHPYDGLYGQDSYAYYYQARALWYEMSGQTMPDQLFTAQALRWPVGYLLHLIAGIVIMGGPSGGRLLTLAMTALTPALLYLIIVQLWRGHTRYASVVAGLVGGAVLPLTGTYTRMGLSIMSDVPAVFWMALAIACCLRAWPQDPPPGEQRATNVKSGLAWAFAMGFALGMAVLVRYGSILLATPIAVYLALLRWYSGSWLQLGPDVRKAAMGLAGFALAMLPQVLYYTSPLAVYLPGAVNYSVWLSDWKLSNIFASSYVSADGAASYPQSNIVFYLVEPFWELGEGLIASLYRSAAAGLLSPAYVPALFLGVWALVRVRRWPALGLLLAWWIVPLLFFSGSPYQSHRFVLVYLPALAALIGIGAGVALDWLARLSGRLRPGLSSEARSGVLTAIVLLGVCVGAGLGLVSVNRWIAIHAAWEADEKRVATAVKQAAGPVPERTQPHVVSFNITAAVYHNTGWPMLDFYNHDEQEIARFLSGPEPHVLVLPERNMATQWAGTPSGMRWEWLRRSYEMSLVAQVGEYSVYRLGGGR